MKIYPIIFLVLLYSSYSYTSDRNFFNSLEISAGSSSEEWYEQQNAEGLVIRTNFMAAIAEGTKSLEAELKRTGKASIISEFMHVCPEMPMRQILAAIKREKMARYLASDPQLKKMILDPLFIEHELKRLREVSTEKKFVSYCVIFDIPARTVLQSIFLTLQSMITIQEIKKLVNELGAQGRLEVETLKQDKQWLSTRRFFTMCCDKEQQKQRLKVLERKIKQLEKRQQQ